MARTAKWSWWQQYTGKDEYRIRELLRAILDLYAYYGDRDIWLWRGQANAAFSLSPAIHTRIHGAGLALDDPSVKKHTRELIQRTRVSGLDMHETVALPDLALLSVLQHYGAATPLLDVSLDPLVALYMAVVSPKREDDQADGVLFAIRRPKEPPSHKRTPPFDTRTFADVYDQLPKGSPILYSAPDVSNRLRIQRGYFLLGRVSASDSNVTIPLTLDHSKIDETWLAKRMAARGSKGSVEATSDVGAFRVPAKFKPQLRDWLEERTGLTADYVYPTPWHQPHLEVFAASHGRRTPI